MTKLRAEGQRAKGLMQSALGVPVEQHDDGSRPGMHDLRILYADRPAAAGEVAAAAEHASVELWHAVNGAGERCVVPSLRGLVWH